VASKKEKLVSKPITNDPDEVEKVRRIASGSAATVNAAAKKLFGRREDHSIGDLLNGDWEDTKQHIDEIDKQFKDQSMSGDIDVRVMQVGPNGTLTDVSDKINPRDLRPDQIADMRSDGSMTVPLGPDGRIDKEAAMSILARIMGSERVRDAKSSSEEAMKRMETTLAESDKILQHWKN
jgi:hypothetical protein